MKDRIPADGKAGRMLITPEDGSAPFYATVTMADEPLEEGTPLNTGDIVSYNGKLYKSTVDNNSWTPDGYPAGWSEVTM